MLYLALSCLQGRLMQQAAQELIDLGIEGLQLTPGLVPTANFKSWLDRHKISYLTHHGFSWYKIQYFCLERDSRLFGNI